MDNQLKRSLMTIGREAISKALYRIAAAIAPKGE